MKDNRYKFPAQCPYCHNHTDWLLPANEIGQHLVDCEHCGKTYVISINLKPETVCVYALVPQVM